MNLKRNHLCLVLAVAFLQPTFLAHWTRAETVEWIQQFGTSAGDQAAAVSADAVGNIFVAGSTSGDLAASSFGASDVFVSKFDALGSVSWTQQLGTSQTESVTGVAADADGNVYVSGTTTGNFGGPNAGMSDAFLSKFNSVGAHLWTRQLGTDRDDSGFDVSVDSLGDVYLTGLTFGSFDDTVNGSEDAFLAKFNADGDQLWAHQSGVEGIDRSFAVDADQDGNVFTAGMSPGNLLWDAFVNRYDAEGELVWTREFRLEASNRANGVAADQDGNVYVAGLTAETFAFPEYYDGFLSKYDQFGTLIWSRQFGDPEKPDSFNHVTVDASGNIVAVGQQRTPGDQYGGVLVTSFDANGELQWSRLLASEGSSSALGVAADPFDRIYVAGSTSGDLGGQNAGGSDAFLAKIRLSDITPGDTDGDGDVDIVDLNNVRNDFGIAGDGIPGDVNDDLIVDLEDLNAVRNNFGASSDVAAVPEPSAALLLAGGCLAIGIWCAPSLGATRARRDHYGRPVTAPSS